MSTMPVDKERQSITTVCLKLSSQSPSYPSSFLTPHFSLTLPLLFPHSSPFSGHTLLPPLYSFHIWPSQKITSRMDSIYSLCCFLCACSRVCWLVNMHVYIHECGSLRRNCCVSQVPAAFAFELPLIGVTKQARLLSRKPQGSASLRLPSAGSARVPSSFLGCL